MSSFRVLCIDGGGINGLVTAVVLSQLENYLIQFSGNKNARLCDYFDFFAGTSAGGILCGTYLCPDSKNDKRPKFSAKDVVDIYIKIGKSIFKNSFLRNLYTFNGLFCAKYSEKKLINALNAVFGDTRLSECLKPCLIPAFNIGIRKCVFFDRENAKAYIERDYYLKDVLRATSSAPSYFPVAPVKPMSNDYSYLIDGGVFANNPSMCAFVELEKLVGWKSCIYNQNVKILSIGIGQNKSTINVKKAKNWGKASWALPILGIFMDAISQTADYQLRTIFHSDFVSEHRYLRIDGTKISDLPCLGSLDDASDSNIENCIKYGEKLCSSFSERMKVFAKQLIINE
ncbi:MAG: hypothetical protein A2Y17_13680 [Clostridiales bacterium GWF2_38_85]|nr:MAG: hypothetical protein A2Y17_13680 [Clostridiales bacterium GWF2_38_85]